MASYNFGKKRVCKMLREKFNLGDRVLDIGPCNGKWYNLLSNYFKMDAVEIWKPYILKYNLLNKYENLYFNDILKHDNFKYDVIIMGDVLEHLSIPDAQKILKKMYDECKELVVAVPYRFWQPAINRNPYEIHLQPDLTPKNFMERYPGFKLFWGNRFYGYYIKDTK
ncbi:MAG: hypothetical protein PHQ62_00265 [Clostridia bacterium]|nr:hypothetical protein [Clostridia bacterium]